ncbi:MAG: helix-turn-helix domain-containing protein [Saprospiraceae bacterium]|nr:helix-turn-helix domain-containing protein [Saprospiraceae bacterium]
MIRPIKSNKQYENYLQRAYELMQKDLQPNSNESDELELLGILIEKYERENYPIEPPHPIEAILFRLDQMNMKTSELSEILGSRSRASEVLSGKRKLSLSMIRKLHSVLNIQPEILIKDYQVSER